MNPELWGFIGAIAGAIVGAAASIVTTIISGGHTRKLQEQSDSFQRSERARNFQRENLLEAQETLAAYMRLVGRAHLEDSTFFRQNPDPSARPILSADLNEEIMNSSRRLMLLTERIENEEIRNEIKKLRSSVNMVLDARSITEGENILSRSGSAFQHLMSSVGTVLRHLY